MSRSGCINNKYSNTLRVFVCVCVCDAICDRYHDTNEELAATKRLQSIRCEKVLLSRSAKAFGECSDTHIDDREIGLLKAKELSDFNPYTIIRRYLFLEGETR